MRHIFTRTFDSIILFLLAWWAVAQYDMFLLYNIEGWFWVHLTDNPNEWGMFLFMFFVALFWIYKFSFYAYRHRVGIWKALGLILLVLCLAPALMVVTYVAELSYFIVIGFFVAPFMWAVDYAVLVTLIYSVVRMAYFSQLYDPAVPHKLVAKRQVYTWLISVAVATVVFFAALVVPTM